MVHLFNLGGYMLWHQYLVERSDRRMNELISHNLYDPNKLIELKIKQNLPGIREWTDFENVSGHVQLKNTSYNYVKLKFTKDTLYIMCVPNYEKTKLIDNNVIYAKQINDIPLEKKGQESSVKKGADNKYSHSEIEFRFLSFRDEHLNTLKPIHLNVNDPFIPVHGQPPEILS